MLNTDHKKTLPEPTRSDSIFSLRICCKSHIFCSFLRLEISTDSGQHFKGQATSTRRPVGTAGLVYQNP